MNHKKRVIGGILMLGWSGLSLAGGLGLPLQNVTNLGTAYAGTASLAADASTNFWNAAGLTQLRGEQLVVGGVASLPTTRLDVTSATSAGRGLPLGSGSTRPRNSALIPSMHYANRLNHQWTWGMSVVVPFGSKTNYQENSIARYTATRSELFTMDFAPSLAYQFNDGLSLAAGPDFLYTSAVLRSRVNIANTDPANDGFVHNIASRTGIGYHFGLLKDVHENTRLGLNYRSKVVAKLKGDNQVQLAPGAAVSTQRVNGNLVFPETVIASLHHDLTPHWAVMGDVQWTHWNQFKELNLSFENGNKLFIPENYRNSYRFALGGIYEYNEVWRFKFGGSYEQRSTETLGRSIYVPDQAQITPAVGVQYRLNKKMALDLAYAHIFFKKADINMPGPANIGLPQTQSLQGTLKHQINAIGLQLTWDL